MIHRGLYDISSGVYSLTPAGIGRFEPRIRAKIEIVFEIVEEVIVES